jgi:hypothetical protein
MVTMFREGERVSLAPRPGNDAQTVETTLRSISGNTLTVDAFQAQGAFPAGSTVTSVDGSSASFLTTGIPPGTRVTFLTVQGFAPGQSVVFPDGRSLALKVLDDSPNQLDLGQRLRVPEFYLVYSGAHTVEVS